MRIVPFARASFPATMNEIRPRGRPRTTGGKNRCGRCNRSVSSVQRGWPEGPICNPCHYAATRTFGECPNCGREGMLPGRRSDGTDTCVSCAGITAELVCDSCGREAPRHWKGICVTCALNTTLNEILRPNDPPDLRLHRLIRAMCAVERPASILTWCRPGTRARELLEMIGARDLQLTHEAFDALPQTTAVTHLRAILIHHGILARIDYPHLRTFEKWVEERLQSLEDMPEIHSPIERFARWHHLRRLTAEAAGKKNMDNATRYAKQEITEAGKFLQWLRTTHRRSVIRLNQAHVDEYLASGPSTRSHIRNFIRYLLREGTIKGVDVPYRVARQIPTLTEPERIGHIRRVMETEDFPTAFRLFALLHLLYGVPIVRICMLTRDDVQVTPLGANIKFGEHLAPIPDTLIPLLMDHLNGSHGRQTMNSGTTWLFPGNKAGQHLATYSAIQMLRNYDVPIQAARNTTIRRLVEELDPTSLSRLIGYSEITLARHATAATVPWSSYVTDKNPRFRQSAETRREVGLNDQLGPP